MSPARLLCIACVLLAGVFGPAQAAPPSPASAAAPGATQSQAAAPAPESPFWTNWGAPQYAMADDGTSIWIGGTGGAVRWNKAAGSYRRYSRLDGLPHTKVLAVAVDAAGNRWFGGDGGLSLLDASESWTHVGQSAGGLYSDLVDGIAVVGGDALYLSHGLPDGSISRRDPDGAWRWFPNREAAIVQDYAALVQTPGATPLWTVAGQEIWAGTHVFDGERWYERTLPDGNGEPKALAVDSRNHVWALHGDHVYEWEGSTWITHRAYPAGNITGSGQVLAVDSSDTVWIGGMASYLGIGLYYTYVMPLNTDLAYKLESLGPVAALLTTTEGVWAAGPSWLMLPDFSVKYLDDQPRFAFTSDAAVDASGKLWVFSEYYPGYSHGVAQSLDDRGTLPLEDDLWELRPRATSGSSVTAAERAPDGIWYAEYYSFKTSVSIAVRYNGDERVEYDLSMNSMYYKDKATDIFAQDARHTWFATSAGIISLDDGGTPADQTDDIWQAYPIEGWNGKVWVAVDAAGQLWHSHWTGLYRYDGAAWQLVFAGASDSSRVCDLAPAADGTLYAHYKYYGGGEDCGNSMVVVIVRPNREVDTKGLDWLIESEAGMVGSARQRNDMWSISPDGAIWYVNSAYTVPTLHRVRGQDVRAYALPPGVTSVERLEVDRRGHVWLAANSQLWRMAGPAPRFSYLPVVGR